MSVARIPWGFRACLILGLILIVAGVASAEIPRKINYQGRVTDSVTGQPLRGNHDMTFRIYDASIGGTILWYEQQTVTADSAGVVSVMLGGLSPIGVSFDDACWLEVEVGGEILLPRRELASVPYAFHASDSDSLGGLGPDDYVSENELSSITGEMIADGEITDDDIAGDASIDPAKIDGTAWTAANDGAGSGLDADMVDGLNADAFADTGHLHDERYYSQDRLNTPGTINQGSNPVDWTNLKNVPAGFADGTDEGGGAGDGHSLDAADGNPVDVVFVNDAGNVGVGTLAPGEKLDVNGSVNLSDYLKIDERTVLSTDGLYNVYLGRAVGSQSTGEYNAFLGCRAGSSNTTGFYNTFVGFDAGFNNTTGYVNTFLGMSAGEANTTGGGNVFLGCMTGYGNTTADYGTCVGYYAGREHSTGDGNTFVGAGAGEDHEEGYDNCFIGRVAGYENVSGNTNTCLGSFTGCTNTTGSGNVFVGYKAGYNEMGSNKLYIANSDADPPLIYGDFASARVGIGTTSPSEALEVNGTTKITAAGSPLKLLVLDQWNRL